MFSTTGLIVCETCAPGSGFRHESTDWRRGNPGDHKPVGGGVNELRIDEGPGYRVYYTHRGAVLVILLCGGNKSTQQADIDRAKALAANLDTD